MEWAKNWVMDQVSGYAKTGIQAGGTLAGNAVGGVGSLIENSGRSLGRSTSGAIGGVGGCINNYGRGIQNSMAADGPVGAGSANKSAVKAPRAAKRTADGRQKRGGPKALPAANASVAKPKAFPSATPSSLKPAAMPAQAPPPTNRTLPAKKPIPRTTPAVTKAPGTNPFPSITSTPTPGTTPRAPLSTGQSEKSADGKVRISPSARPAPVKPAITPLARLAASDEASRPTTVRAPVSTRQSPTRADGKVRISAESRPRHVPAN